MTAAASPFRGLCAYPITPADAGGRVDTGALDRLLDRLLDAGVDAIGLLGSTGTYAYLDREQRRRAVQAASRRIDGRVPLAVGIGALRTDAAVALARDAQAAGADGLLLAPVSYTPLLEEEVFRHFAAVAAASALPLCVYDNPSTTRFGFTDALLARLAALPGIAALKRPAPEPGTATAVLAAQRAVLPPGFLIGCSADWHAVEAILGGADAWHSVLGGLLPAPCVALMRGCLAGDLAEAARLDAALSPIWRLFRRFGSLRVVHAAANLLALTDAQPPLPILPLDRAARGEIEAALAPFRA